MIPGSGISAREGIGYPRQYSWTSPPAMREPWVQCLGWEDPLEEGMATHSSIPAWRIPMDRGAWWVTVYRAGHEFTTNHTYIYLIKELYLEYRRILTTQEKIYNSTFKKEITFFF